MCKELNVDVYFEEQNIHTMSEDGKLMLTILASFAQAESLSVAVLFLHINFCSAVEDEYQVSVFSYLDGVDSLMKGLKNISYSGFFTFEADNFFAPSFNEKSDVEINLEMKIKMKKLLYSIGENILKSYSLS